VTERRKKDDDRDSVDDEAFSASSEYREELVRLTREKADKISLENEMKRGKLVYKADVEKVWTDVVMTIRAQLLNIPKSLAFRLSKTNKEEEVEAILRAAVDTLLLELSGQTERRE